MICTQGLQLQASNASVKSTVGSHKNNVLEKGPIVSCIIINKFVLPSMKSIVDCIKLLYTGSTATNEQRKREKHRLLALGQRVGKEQKRIMDHYKEICSAKRENRCGAYIIVIHIR